MLLVFQRNANGAGVDLLTYSDRTTDRSRPHLPGATNQQINPGPVYTRNLARLGARIGLTAVLHTWTQKLCYHPHVHCIVAGGGINADGTQWVSTKRRFFLPVRILSTVFRGKLLDKLERAQHKGELRQRKNLPDRWLQYAAKKKWVIYSKRP